MSSQTEEDCKETVGTLQGALSRAMTTLSRKLDQLTILQQNTTSELKTLRSRQAVSAGFQAISLTILFLYLGLLMIRAIIRYAAKKQEAKNEQMVEMMKSKRKAAMTRAMAARAAPMEQ